MTAPGEPILQALQVSAARGRTVVVRDFDLSLRTGEVAALLGPNGAGKSTVIDAICGLAPKRSGTVRLQTLDITHLPPHHIARLGLIQVSQNRDLFPSMSVADNLRLGLEALPRDRRRPECIDRMLEFFPRLRERWRQRADSLSGGEQQMLAIARALVAEPRVLLLDEPSAGLAPIVVNQIVDFLRTLTTTGLTVLLVEQNVGIALELCDRFCVLKGGKKVFEGDRTDLGGEPRARLAELYI